jgi:hypothetical protein
MSFLIKLSDFVTELISKISRIYIIKDNIFV